MEQATVMTTQTMQTAADARRSRATRIGIVSSHGREKTIAVMLSVKMLLKRL